MKKSLVAFAMTMTMAVTALSACGGSSAGTGTTVSSEDVTKSAVSTAAATAAAKAASTTAQAASTAAGATDSGKKKVVGVILNHTQDVFMKNLQKGVQDAAAKYPNLDVKVVESGQDPNKQLSQVEEFISEKVDIICLNPCNQESSATAIDEAAAAKIPILTFNTMSTDEAQKKCVTYVGSDAIESGKIQGKYVCENILHGKGTVAYIQAIIGHQAQIDREKGFKEILAQYPDIKIVLDGSANFKQDEGMKLCENWLQSGTKFDCIVSQGSDMAYGAVLALQEAGKAGQIPVSAIDMSEDIANCLKDGSVSNSVFQDAFGQGSKTIETADKILKGEKVDTYIDIPYELVTKDNMANYDGRY